MTARKRNASGWIDARIELPGESERVLLYTPYQFFGEDHACIGNRESLVTCTTSVMSKQLPVFTHWMPLPNEPGKSR